ncbi:hypothetical protein [Micromonospora avicenniae]|uniref:Nicotinamide mononucleotide transporter n=1 Tax=Micromonospora avicenniae TaxID=1198245 RepID=A0A1N7DKU0_9ACTN|nr:hypothetical protein [Micromonospora avicenniae]SIR76388.1 nicotinamide mononucleotide transporter [Micromonospora avicenniae]
MSAQSWLPGDRAAEYFNYGAFCAWGVASRWRTSQALRPVRSSIPSTYPEAVA